VTHFNGAKFSPKDYLIRLVLVQLPLAYLLHMSKRIVGCTCGLGNCLLSFTDLALSAAKLGATKLPPLVAEDFLEQKYFAGPCFLSGLNVIDRCFCKLLLRPKAESISRSNYAYRRLSAAQRCGEARKRFGSDDFDEVPKISQPSCLGYLECSVVSRGSANGN